MTEHMRPEMVGIGSTVYDTLMRVDHYPEEDTKMQGIETKVQGGGPCATALAAASKLGISAAYMGTVGDDPFGDFMMADLERIKVDTSRVLRISGKISFHAVILLSGATSSRTCVWNRGDVPPPRPEDLDREMLEHAKVLHLDGHMRDAALSAAKICKKAGVKVSLDAGGMLPGIGDLCALADWLIPSEEFALKLTGEKDAREAAKSLYEKFRPEALVITQGVKGGLLMDEKGLRAYRSYKVTAVDTNGCGDTFHGAFAAGKIKGMDNDRACRYASAAAAVKCTRLGARNAMPTDEECRRFLSERGEEL